MRIQSLSQEDIQHYEKTYKDIYQLYTTQTITMKAIGDIYGITKQRVWQIIRKIEKGDGDYYYQHRAKGDYSEASR
tara:strand:- start:297 stop:524 length:228 start_codon:yes stop_codon:yes gene_type:complete